MICCSSSPTYNDLMIIAWIYLVSVVLHWILGMMIGELNSGRGVEGEIGGRMWLLWRFFFTSSECVKCFVLILSGPLALSQSNAQWITIIFASECGVSVTESQESSSCRNFMCEWLLINHTLLQEMRYMRSWVQVAQSQKVYVHQWKRPWEWTSSPWYQLYWKLLIHVSVSA